MRMEKFEYHNLLKKLNEEQRLIFDDVMHRKQLYKIHQYVYFL
jgi:hypothetical protein